VEVKKDGAILPFSQISLTPGAQLIKDRDDLTFYTQLGWINLFRAGDGNSDSGDSSRRNYSYGSVN
jgi:hypothetical protein